MHNDLCLGDRPRGLQERQLCLTPDISGLGDGWHHYQLHIDPDSISNTCTCLPSIGETYRVEGDVRSLGGGGSVALRTRGGGRVAVLEGEGKTGRDLGVDDHGVVYRRVSNTSRDLRAVGAARSTYGTSSRIPVMSALSFNIIAVGSVGLGSGSGRRCRAGLRTTSSGATTHLGLEVVQRLVGGHGRGLAGGGGGLTGLGGVAEDDGGAHGAGVLAVENGELATMPALSRRAPRADWRWANRQAGVPQRSHGVRGCGSFHVNPTLFPREPASAH